VLGGGGSLREQKGAVASIVFMELAGKELRKGSRALSPYSHVELAPRTRTLDERNLIPSAPKTNAVPAELRYVRDADRHARNLQTTGFGTAAHGSVISG
jgi:hypothetical protein